MPTQTICVINDRSGNYGHFYLGYKHNYNRGVLLYFNYGPTEQLRVIAWTSGGVIDKKVALESE